MGGEEWCQQHLGTAWTRQLILQHNVHCILWRNKNRNNKRWLAKDKSWSSYLRFQTVNTCYWPGVDLWKTDVILFMLVHWDPPGCHILSKSWVRGNKFPLTSPRCTREIFEFWLSNPQNLRLAREKRWFLMLRAVVSFERSLPQCYLIITLCEVRRWQNSLFFNLFKSLFSFHVPNYTSCCTPEQKPNQACKVPKNISFSCSPREQRDHRTLVSGRQVVNNRPHSHFLWDLDKLRMKCCQVSTMSKHGDCSSEDLSSFLIYVSVYFVEDPQMKYVRWKISLCKKSALSKTPTMPPAASETLTQLAFIFFMVFPAPPTTFSSDNFHCQVSFKTNWFPFVSGAFSRHQEPSCRQTALTT